MTPNIGSTERTIRLIAGAVLLSLVFILPGNARWWGLIGLVLIGTALVRWCPGWAILGINTSKK